ncbi:TonB-dependent receptor plug domain-containing protein [Tenacibaculum sp. UWU-22]|uniref:TonB-dependent receptor plug domain-containing protein n=1 Tax=Tenacibaculum sp. UWU-22 TaxID=3234187 RepID=UPI0034DB0790
MIKNIIVLFFCLLNFKAIAQTVTVLDKKTKKPIPEVVLFNLAKTGSIITNNKGIADISMFKTNEVIVFSHVSYQLRQIKKRNLVKHHYTIYLSKQNAYLDEVVISVFKKEEKSNRIAEQIAVVNTQEIQEISPQTSADLLAAIPGIKVQKSQFGGGSPVLRGMESNRVLLVVDGVRMNNAIYRKGHLQNAITVSPNLLDRTEVIFGPSSVMYGSDALGGVIHYYTKTPKLSNKTAVKSNLFSRFSSINREITTNVSAELRLKKWASFTSVSYSDFNDLTMGKNRSHGFENWGKVAYYSKNNTDNYNEKPTLNSDPNIQRNTGYRQTDVLQKFYVPLSKKTDLKLNFQYSTSTNIPRFDKLTELKDDTDASSLKFAEWYYGPQQRLLISPQLEINPNKKWIEKGTFTFAYQNIKESRIQRKFGSLKRSYRKEGVNVFNVNGDFSVPLAKSRNLSYGFEFSYNDVSSNAFGKKLSIENNKVVGFSGDFAVQSRYPDGGSNYSSSAIYGDYRQDINEKSTLNTGVRLTNTQLAATWNDNTFITLPNSHIKLKNTAVTATIGYVYRPTKNWQLNAVLSSGFRSPNIDDVGKVREKNGKVTVPNINLKPEYAYNSEIGIQKHFNNNRFRIGISAYYTLLRKYIYRDYFTLNGSSTIIYDDEEGKIVANQNKGNAYITGFTASYQGNLFENWKTTGFITYTKGKTYDSKEPMSSIPPLFGDFNLNYSKNKIETGINIRFNARKKVNQYNTTEGIDNIEQTPIINANATEDTLKYYGSPSWVSVGLNGKYSINEIWAVQAQLTNLFDQHYKEFASGISAPGRNLSVSLLVGF